MESLGPYELNATVLGDCLEVMGPIPDNSVDSIVTDSPYGLSKEPDIVEVLSHWLNGDDYTHRGGGFMGKSWDSFVPGPAVWRECFRVMKPGGCLMAFGGTRTCDLLSIAIRLAGFERFDSLCWLHGSGFAKGADISKKLDAMAGAEREVIGPKSDPRYLYPRNVSPMYKDKENGKIASRGIDDPAAQITAPATEAAALWSGWKSQLKPSHEVILCFWKPREKSFAKNALKWGVSGLNIDGCRIAPADDIKPIAGGNSRFQKLAKDQGFRPYEDGIPAERDGHNDIYYPSPKGRYPANVLLSCSCDEIDWCDCDDG